MPDQSVLQTRLQKARLELLDLSARNRLIHTPLDRVRAKSLAIVNEVSEQVFGMLVRDKRAMSFLPSRDKNADEGEQHEVACLDQPEMDAVGPDSTSDAQSDKRLQTRLSSEVLQRRLRGLFTDANTFEEEQGVNILFLAMGFLKWYDAPTSDQVRYAPLILIPVQLERQNIGTRFKLRALDEDLVTNISLQAKLEGEFGVKLPDLPDADELVPSNYFGKVTDAVADQPRWEVVPNAMLLGFFSFAKFLMYRDLDPKNWPDDRRIDKHRIVNGLLESTLYGEAPLFGNDEKIDGRLHPANTVHVVDADSSQAVVIEEVRRGRNLVVQGPPGTGKSQTIANMIAAAVQDGKTVLFVAEKMAALEVVKRRFDHIDLGVMCLELHSNKANKRAVAEELGRTMELEKPFAANQQIVIEGLTSARDRLNRHAEAIHQRLDPSGLTPYQVIGELVKLRAEHTNVRKTLLQDAITWSPSQLRTKVQLLEDVVGRLKALGIPQDNACRGIMAGPLLPVDIQELVTRLNVAVPRIRWLIEQAATLGELLKSEQPKSILQLLEAAKLAHRLCGAPPMDRHSFADPIWGALRNGIGELVKAGLSFSENEHKCNGVVAGAAWKTDIEPIRRDLAASGRSWFRWLNPKYRAAQRAFEALLVVPSPRALGERLAILDAMSARTMAQSKLDSDQPTAHLGRQAFGSYWQGSKSDWPVLTAIDEWECGCRKGRLPDNFRLVVDAIPDSVELAKRIKLTVEGLNALDRELKVIFGALKLDLEAAFNRKEWRSIPLAELADRLAAWQSDQESISRWIPFRLRLEKLNSEGMADLAAQLYSGQAVPDGAVAGFRLAYFNDVLREMHRRSPDLAEFDGDSHEQVLAAFKQLDTERIALARREVALAHYLRLPRVTGDVGEVGIVKQEINKKRRHLPLRQLLKKAGRAIQAIKPVFMMSPVSLAQFLEPGHLEFDLLLIDEASQVQPVDALGAVARAKQIVVVGDDRQLPPTRFFEKLLGDDEKQDEESEDFAAGDVESILGLCAAKGVSQRMLRWHYRSLHHSLIAVSNHEFYGDGLFVVPSALEEADHLGLKFHHVVDGIFDRGASRTNRIEAKAVAEAVMEHARRCPDMSLGVGAFSVAQRDAVLDELELLRRQDQSVEEFFVSGGREPFFIKNLENIQGDERDVIFISVGYGKDASGYPNMNFGPLSNDGGERRLNVLITRSRVRCEVFSSITADDIDLNRARTRGAAALKAFLAYAKLKLLDVAKPTAGDCDSEFERQVASALRKLGFEVDHQVGVAGFFVDIAVRDPEQPGRYLLGIECDGATYHSSRSARDRDRLRQQVLEGRQWIIHRIWSTDWFHRPEEQLRKTVYAIENAKVTIAMRDQKPDCRPDSRVDEPQIQRRSEPDSPSVNGQNGNSVPYQEADFNLADSRQLHDVPQRELATIVTAVVRAEGPIHRDEIARRVGQLWGLKRTGSRMTEAVDRGLRSALDAKMLVHDGPFYSYPNQTAIVVRNRENVRSATLRRPEMLPPQEIRAGITMVVETHLGAPPDDVIVVTARLFGFAATSGQLKEVIGRELCALLGDGKLIERNGNLYVNDV